MEQYFLDGQPVSAPMGVDGLTLHKERNPRYFSILFQNIGYANGVGNVTFVDETAKRILWETYQAEGIEGDTAFTILRDGESPYTARVDYQTLVYDQNGITVSFHDGIVLTALEANFTTRYPVALTTACTLNPKRLFGPATHALSAGRETLQRATPGNIKFDHSLPLSKPEKTENNPPGAFLTVDDPYNTNQPIYRNTTGERVNLRVSGLVKASALASTTFTATLSLSIWNGSGAVSAVVCGSVTVGTVTTALASVVNTQVSVPPGGWLNIGLSSPIDVNNWKVIYSADTYISLEADTSTVQSSTLPGVLAGDLFRELIRQAGLGEFTAVSSYLDSLNLWITDGYSLVGQSRGVLYATVQDVFEGLNALLNLALDIADNAVSVRSKRSYLDSRGITRIRPERTISTIIRPWLDYQFGDVLGGYSATKEATSLTNSDEVNGSRRWLTTRKGVRQSLDLQCKTLSASASQIEALRLRGLAGNTQTGTVSDEDLNRLYLVCTTLDASGRLVNEGLQAVSHLANLTDTETPYNLRISPGRSLQNWLGFYPLSGLTLAESSGNSTVISRLNGETSDVNESRPTLPASTQFVGEKADVIVSMSMSEYTNLTDWVEFQDPQRRTYRTGLLMGADWRETDDVGRQCSLTLLV